MRRVTVLAAGALLAWAAAGVASAEPVLASDCVWEATTAPMREAMRASLRAHGGITDALTQGEANGLMRACRLSDTSTSAFLVAATLRGRILTLEAEEGLKASRGLAPERLAEGWRRLTPADRRSLARAFGGGFIFPAPVTAALEAWAASLDIGSEADRALLLDYAVGRAQLDSLEGR
jgi:hypothetical protein